MVNLGSEAVIGTGRQERGVVFKEGGLSFSTVVLVVSDERWVVVLGIVSRMAARGKDGTRIDDYQSRRDKFSRIIRHDSQD